MNSEPIQFLPIAPFWKAAEARKRRSTRLVCLGIVIGCGITTVMTIIVILL